MYKVINENIIFVVDRNTFIPVNLLNSDYVEYVKWLADGNTPEPADPLPEPSPVLDPVEKLKAFLAANPDVAAIING